MAIAWADDGSIETAIAAWEASAAFEDHDEEAVVATLFAALMEALYQGQVGGKGRTRWAELLVDSTGARCAPITSSIIMDLATKAHLVRSELASVVGGPTAAENESVWEGTNYDITDLEAAH